MQWNNIILKLLHREFLWLKVEQLRSNCGQKEKKIISSDHDLVIRIAISAGYPQSGKTPETDQKKAEKIPDKSGILSFKVSSQTAKEAAHFFEIVGFQNTAIQSCYQSISVFIYV